MGFVRQPINNTSTFTTGEETIAISIPTFQLWENTTADTRYDLGQGWSMNIPKDGLDLNFQLNGDVVLNISKVGIDDPVLQLTNYALEDHIPDSYSTAGLLARIDGELYMSTATHIPT